MGAASPKATVVTSPYANRLTAATRAAAIVQYGGNPKQVEGAVTKSLNWLVAHQNEDGSWGGACKPAMTGLALLSFLGHGETQKSVEFGRSIHYGVQYLLEFGKKNYNLLGNSSAAYQHAIATCALAEDYALTRNSELPGVLEGAVAIIIKGQTPSGSWNYGYDPQGGNDTSVTGWNIQALKAAKYANIHVEGDDAALRKALGYLHDMYDERRDRFGYRAPNNGGSDGLVGVGIFCMQLLGKGYSKEACGALHTAGTFKCIWEKPSFATSYTWYYVTLAMFHSGREDWTYWNKQFWKEIITYQSPDGHWQTPDGESRAPGHAYCDPTNADDNSVYHTTLLCMTLQTYYRFLPLP